jgi:hypothetical protein
MKKSSSLAAAQKRRRPFIFAVPRDRVSPDRDSPRDRCGVRPGLGHDSTRASTLPCDVRIDLGSGAFARPRLLGYIACGACLHCRSRSPFAADIQWNSNWRIRAERSRSIDSPLTWLDFSPAHGLRTIEAEAGDAQRGARRRPPQTAAWPTNSAYVTKDTELVSMRR